ncbi:MAG TPA: hypothetical protein PLD84_13515, partial [Chitinophagales bacterium]|nr:hypothetical protein [Chitinophagales bacterium]
MAVNRLRFKYRSLVPRWAIFTIDTFIVLTALLFAFLLRFNFHIPAHELQSMYLSIPVMMLVRISGFFLFRIYAGMIQYTGSEDAQRVAIMLALGTLMVGILNFISFKISGNYLVPFSVMIIEFFISVFAMSAYRLGVKVLYEELVQIRKEKSNVIILGANEYGLITKKTLERDPKKDVQVIAFIDNKSDLLRQKMEGVSIYDSKNDLEELLQAQSVDLLIIAVPNIPASRKKQVVDTCLKYNVRVLHVPPMSKWINGEL